MASSGEVEIIRPMLISLGMPVWANGVVGQVVEVISSTEVLIREQGGRNYFKCHVGLLRSMEDPRVEPPPKVVQGVEDLHSISSERLEIAKRRYEAILPLLNGKLGRAELEAHAKAHGTSVPTLYRWNAAYELGGRVLTSLLPRTHERGPAGQNRLRPEVDQIIREEIQKDVRGHRRKPKVAKILRESRRRCRDLHLPKPGYKAVRIRAKQLSDFTLIHQADGLSEANRAFRIHEGPHPEVRAPLDEVQIDHALLNVQVVSDESREPIGRPWVTIAIDIHSRMVLGYYLTLDAPSVVSVAMCLVHSVTEKGAWLKRFSIDKAWPCYGVPNLIYADNDKNFTCNSIKWACNQYGIALQWRPVRTPNWGGHIERLIGTVKRELEDFCGKADPKRRGRGSYDDSKAFLTLGELDHLITLFFVGTYNIRKHRGIDAVPMKMWELGIVGGPNTPGRGLPPLIQDQGRFFKDFLPAERRKVHEYGVTIDKITYFDPVLRGLIDYRGSGAGNKGKLVLFRIDPRDISLIYFYSEFDGAYVPIPYRNPRHPAVSRFEVRWATRRLRALGQTGYGEDDIFDTIAEMRRVVSQAKADTKKARRLAARRRNHEKADPHGKGVSPEPVEDELKVLTLPESAWGNAFEGEIKPYSVTR